MSEERVVSDLVWTPEQGLSAPEVRGIAWDNFLLSDEKYLGKWKTDSGIRVTPETALQSTVVLACCRILAETVSGLPVHVYRRNPDGSDDIAKEIPLYKILTFKPNEWQTKAEFFEQIMMNLTLWGNSYTRVRSGLYGSVSFLDNLHPSRMDVERLENGRLRYSYTDPETGRLERYTQDQIMHVRWTPEQDGIKGMVPVEIAREAIGLARACEQHAARFWANSARPGVVLQTDGTLTAEAAERLRDNWERLHRGSDRAYRTAILTGGLKAQELGMTNEASQFQSSRAFQTEEICRIYRIAQHLIQGTPGGDLEVQGQEFVTYTLMPWLNRIESAISRSLIHNDDEFYAKFDVRGLLRANSNARASYYSTMINLGVYTINDCRRAEGMKTLGPIGDHHFVPMNTQTLEDATKPKPEAPPGGGMPGMPGGGGGGGDGPPPPVPGGPPSMSEVKTGKAPIASPKGEASKPKMEDAVEESSADWEDAVEGRAFCATGAGGGVKNDCGGSSVPANDRSLKEKVDFVPIAGGKNSDFAVPPTQDELTKALTGSNQSKGTKIGQAKSIDPGTPVALRIDIPAFNWSKENLGKSVYAVTIHENKGGKGFGSPISYEPMARLSGPVTFASKEKDAIKVATGESSKFPLATVKGQFDPSKEVPADIDSWTPVGYDPKKAAYFYDKKSGQEVKGGTDAVSVGNTVFVRVPEYGERYAQHHYRSLADSWGLESRALSPANQELYEAQEEIVEENGKWPQADAHYMESNPFASRGMKCSNCLYYEAGQCEIVQGSVSPEGICKLWIIPEEKITSPEQRGFCPTGDGGGIDNSCGGKGGASVKMAPDRDVGGGRASRPDTESPVTISKLLEKIASNPDGFTLDPLSAEQPADGIMVSEFANDSVRSVKIKASEIKTPAGMESLSKWYARNRDLLVNQKDRFVGGWKTGDDFYIDVSTRFPPEQAQQALEAGRKAGQLAVFNLGTFKETWVQYEQGDDRKPPEYDKAFAKARKDSQEKQVYGDDTPAIQDEDWASELTKHGKTTVRNYNGTSEEDASYEQSSSAFRHSEQADDHRGLPCDEGILREGRGVEGQQARSGVVRRRPGEVPVALGGSAGGSEERDDCGRGPGGIFGPGNKCQEDGSLSDAFGNPVNAKSRSPEGGGVAAPRADSGWKKLEGESKWAGESLRESPPAKSLAGVKSVTMLDGKMLSKSLKETGVTLDQAARVCGSLTAEANVTIAHGTLADIAEYITDPSLRDVTQSSVTVVTKQEFGGIPDAVGTAASLTRTDDDALLLSYSMFSVAPEVQQSSAIAVGREMYKGVVKSITEAEKLGVEEVNMLAAGSDRNDEFKGYRIWPRLGFDGVIPRGRITPTYSLRLGFFEPYGSKIPDVILSPKAKGEKKAGALTIQSLYETKEGQKWWEENGGAMAMSLQIGNDRDPGWQRYKRISDRVSGRDILEVLDIEWRSIREEVESRGFCPTGEGNGIDNSCGSGTATAGVDNSWKKSGREYLYEPGEGKSPIAGGEDIKSLSIEKPKNVADAMKTMRIKSLTDVVAIGGGLTRGSSTSIVAPTHADGEEIHVMSEVPVDPDDEDAGWMSSTVSLGIDPEGKKYVDYGTMHASSDSGTANFSGTDAARVSSILLEKFPESLAAAEKAGFSYAKTFAMGDVDNEFKGYRLWPQFGFDGEIYDDVRQTIPKDVVPHDEPLTIQELISTPAGDKWWKENGSSMGMTLNLKDKKSDGYKRYQRMAKLAERLKKRNEGRSLYDVLMSEERGFCATGEGGGIDNSCGGSQMMAPDRDMGGSASATQSSPVQSGKPASVRIDSQERLDHAISSLGASGVDDVISLGGGNLRGSDVAIAAMQEPDGSSYVQVSTIAPVERDGSSSEKFYTDVSIRVGPDGKEMGFETLGMSHHGQMTKANEQKVMSLVAEKVVESVDRAEQLNFDRITTWAVGDRDNGYKGYRLWPQFGFDGDIPREVAKKIPAELVLKAKGIEAPPPGSTSIPHDMVVKGLASRHRNTLTIQELLKTTEGDRWWDKNGSDINLTLDLKDKGSLGYKRWEKMKSLLPTLKKRNETREFFDALVEERGFCPTGEGGGIDNSCGNGDSGSPTDAFGGGIGGFARTGSQGGGVASSGDKAAPSVVNNPTAPARVEALATQALFDGREKLDLPRSRGAVSEETISRAMTQRAIAAHGGTPINVDKKMSESDLEATSDALARDTEGAYQRTGRHAGWYSQDVGDSIEIASKLPGNEKIASDPVDRFVFGFGMGILSAQNTVKDNFRFADGFYRNWKETGSLVVPEEYAHVLGRGVDTSHFKTMQAIVDQNGWTDTMRFFSGEDTVRQIENDGRVILAGSDMTVGKEHKGTVVPRLAVFGPKIGPFTHAIVNGNFDHLVMDRWTMRQAGSITGTLLEETHPDTVKGNAQRVLDAASGIRGGHDLWQGLSKSDVVSSLKKVAKSGYLDRESPAWEFIRRTQSAYARSASPTGGGFGDKTELNKAANAAFKNKVQMNLAPGNGTVASNVREMFNRAARKVGASNVLEVQALGWGDTQKLWQHLGYRLRVEPDNNTFSHVASMLRDGGMKRITTLRDEAEEVAREKAKRDAEKAAKKGKRSQESINEGYPSSSDWPYLDSVGSEPQLVFDESMSDESVRQKVVDHVTSLIKKSKQDSRSRAADAVIERRSAGETTIVMPQAGTSGLHVMGFDAEIPSDLVEKLPESLSHCRSLLDLHVSSEGRSWWEQNGREIDVSIDLNGVQGRVFDAFVAGKEFSDILEEGILDDYGEA